MVTPIARCHVGSKIAFVGRRALNTTSPCWSVATGFSSPSVIFYEVYICLPISRSYESGHLSEEFVNKVNNFLLPQWKDHTNAIVRLNEFRPKSCHLVKRRRFFCAQFLEQANYYAEIARLNWWIVGSHVKFYTWNFVMKLPLWCIRTQKTVPKKWPKVPYF